MATPPTTRTKDPQAKLDWLFNWAKWLGDDTLVEATVTVQDGLTKVSDAIGVGYPNWPDTTVTKEDAGVVVWLEGGTAKQQYTVTCRIVTAAGRINEDTMTITVKDQ